MKDSLYSKSVNKASTIQVETKESNDIKDKDYSNQSIPFESKLTRKAVNDYALKKSRYFKSGRLFDDELIASKS